MTYHAETLPIALRTDKSFRRWLVLHVPWAYRRFVSYHHLRGLDLSSTAAKLNIRLDRAQQMLRQSQPMLVTAIRTYSREQLKSGLAPATKRSSLAIHRAA